MRKWIWLLFISVHLFAQGSEQKTPEQIEKELQADEARFERAKQMFNPWYTGPLITPAAGMMPPGHADIQPYIFVKGAWAGYNKERETVSLPHNVYSLQVVSGLLTGITNSVDFTIITGGIVNWQNHKSGGGYNDLSAIVGFCITPQTLYVPAIKFTITETFPTGKYKNLGKHAPGLNSTGGGSYLTQFGIATSKLIWWLYEHPMHLRYFIAYAIETPVHVKGFNTYGGGFGTSGVVRPGNTFTSDLGIEWSFTRRWVLALDVVYVAQGKTKFHGTHGVLAGGVPAPVGSGYSDNLSLAPAIEYNWNANLGIVWGVQFSVYGRNSPVFANGQFSVTYTW